MADYTDKLTLAAWNAATEGRGNTKLVWGTYTGTGEYGSAHPNTLTFDGVPLYVVVRPCINGSIDSLIEMTYGHTYYSTIGNYARSIYFIWTGNSVSWYNTEYASVQKNETDTQYYYIALIGM